MAAGAFAAGVRPVRFSAACFLVDLSKWAALVVARTTLCDSEYRGGCIDE